jgi:hypothetical protein
LRCNLAESSIKFKIAEWPVHDADFPMTDDRLRPELAAQLNLEDGGLSELQHGYTLGSESNQHGGLRP